MCRKRTGGGQFFAVGHMKYIARPMSDFLLSVGNMYAQSPDLLGSGILVQENAS